mmetsp:Transcript_16047/g.34691  ORF Transcript_16047/g.34691 Transcript_16047/m.34691 type:complete len:332 (-) Transcript_16047:47-1042(-)
MEAAGVHEPSAQLIDAGWRDPDRPLAEIYSFERNLGAGVFGSVYAARHVETNEIVAIKRLNFENDQDGVPALVVREVSILRDFKHPNVVKMLDMRVVDGVEYHLVFEYVDNDLHRELRRLRRAEQLMDMARLVSWSLDLLNGIHACHVRLILHRDLKPQNILVAPTGLKICDFGLSRLHSPMVRQGYSHDVVTLWYRCPEILLGADIYGAAVDIWSAGCIIAEMATSRAIFPGDSEIGTLFLIFRMLGTPNEARWPGVRGYHHFRDTFPKWEPTDFQSIMDVRPDLEPHGRGLLRGLLAMNPQVRLTARQAKNHQCFAFFHQQQAHRAQQT